MAVTIGRTADTEDDGTGTVGTVFNNAWKTALYNQIDAMAAQLSTVGSFTATLTGVAGTVTAIVRYTTDGDKVQMDVPFLSGTSNATSKTITGLPTALRPARNKVVTILASDNGAAYVVGWAFLNSATGVITLHPNGAAGAWTASGVSEMQPFQMSYTLA